MLKIFSLQTIKAGFIVGTLDILAAFLHFYIKTQKNPLFILEYIASAALGKEVFNTGAAIMLLGLGFHFFIAISFTFLFFILAKHFPRILAYKLLTGIVYGIFIWAAMRFLVLPFTRLSLEPIQFQNALISIFILIVCIGIPLCYMAEKARK